MFIELRSWKTVKEERRYESLTTLDMSRDDGVEGNRKVDNSDDDERGPSKKPKFAEADVDSSPDPDL